MTSVSSIAPKVLSPVRFANEAAEIKEAPAAKVEAPAVHEPEMDTTPPGEKPPPSVARQTSAVFDGGMSTIQVQALDVPTTRPRSNAVAGPNAIPFAIPIPVAVPVQPSPAKPVGTFQKVGQFFSGIGASVRNTIAARAETRTELAVAHAAAMSEDAVKAYVKKAAPRLQKMKSEEKFNAIRKDPVLSRGLVIQCDKEWSSEQLKVMVAVEQFNKHPDPGWGEYTTLMDELKSNVPNISDQLSNKLKSVTQQTFNAEGKAAVAALNTEMRGILVREPVKRMLLGQ